MEEFILFLRVARELAPRLVAVLTRTVAVAVVTNRVTLSQKDSVSSLLVV